MQHPNSAIIFIVAPGSDPGSMTVVKSFDRVDFLRAEVAQAIIEHARACVENRGSFNLAVSGGSLIHHLASSHLSSHAGQNWNVYLVDERMVPQDNLDSNYGTLRKAFEGTNFGAAVNWLPVPIDENLDVSRAAQSYQSLLPDHLDMCLLGMGPDGHTASLFPNHPDFDVEDKRICIPIRNSPKPPPERISLTIPYLNATSKRMFVVTGDHLKKKIFETVISGKSDLPASYIYDPTWFVNFTS